MSVTNAVSFIVAMEVVSRQRQMMYKYFHMYLIVSIMSFCIKIWQGTPFTEAILWTSQSGSQVEDCTFLLYFPYSDYRAV